MTSNLKRDPRLWRALRDFRRAINYPNDHTYTTPYDGVFRSNMRAGRHTLRESFDFPAAPGERI